MPCMDTSAGYSAMPPSGADYPHNANQAVDKRRPSLYTAFTIDRVKGCEEEE